MPQANSTTSRPRATSPAASAATLPCSSVISLASSVAWSRISSRNANRVVARLASETRRQSFSASRAAATARSTSAGLAKSTWPVTCPVAGSYTSPCRSASPFQGLPPIQWLMCLLTWPCLLVHGGQGVGQDGQALLGLGLAQGQRGRHPQRGPVQAALADQQPALLRALQHPGGQRRARLLRLGVDQVHREHQALAAHLADDWQRARRFAEPADDQPAGHGGVALQVVGQQVVQGGVAGRGGDGVAAEGGDAVAADTVEQFAAGHHAADGEAVAQSLGERHRVRGDPVRGDAPEVLAGTAPAGLHLVGDQQDAVLVEDLLVRGEQPVGRHGEPAHALHRLGQQAADVGRVNPGGQQGPQVLHAGLDVVGVGQVR